MNRMSETHMCEEEHDIHIAEIPEQEKDNETERVLKEIMNGNFPIRGRDPNLQIKELKWTPTSVKWKQSIQRQPELTLNQPEGDSASAPGAQYFKDFLSTCYHEGQS